MSSTDSRSTRHLPGRPTAADLVTVDSRSCSPFSTVLEAALVFRDEDCGTLPVLDAGKLIGVVTDRDIALGVPEYPDLAARPVSDVMSRDVAEIRPDEPLDAIERGSPARGFATWWSSTPTAAWSASSPGAT